MTFNLGLIHRRKTHFAVMPKEQANSVGRKCGGMSCTCLVTRLTPLIGGLCRFV